MKSKLNIRVNIIPATFWVEGRTERKWKKKFRVNFPLQPWEIEKFMNEDAVYICQQLTAEYEYA